MKERELRRTLAVFTIGSVMKLTDLTARQIRYYEEQGLLLPDRTDGNRRLYSLNDMDRLLEIKDFLSDGLNIAAIKRRYQEQTTAATQKQTLSDAEVRRLLQDEIRHQGGFGTPTNNLSRLRF